MRVEASSASISWIPSEAVTGLMKAGFSTGLSHYDEPPPGSLGGPDTIRGALEEMRDRDAFRFSNLVHAWAEFDGDTVVDAGQDGGIVMGATTVRVGKLGATFQAVRMSDLQPEPEIGPGYVAFTQTSGGRTALPLPRAISRAPFFRLQAPLVWSTLTLTLRSDGTSEVGMAGASPFPRHWVYGPDGELALKAGVADWSSWVGQPSWKRTPWGDEDSPVLVTAAETALERELSRSLMHGDAKPRIRSFNAGELIAEQGQPGNSLFLVLDGVVSISVGGEALGELGPGAVLGERAVLEGGVRTASVTAVTPVRVAEASAEQIDVSALTELSQGHRREEQTAR